MSKEKRLKVTLTVHVPDDEYHSEEGVARQIADVVEANEGWHISDWTTGTFKKAKRDAD